MSRVALRCLGRADQDCFVGGGDVRAGRIGLGKNRDRPQTEQARAADDSKRDFAAISDQ